jgi:anti-anti-sigma regulatory factor
MAAGTIERPTQLAPGDHTCWGYSSPASKAEALLAFLDEGAEGGDQLLYVGPGTAEDLTRHLAALPHQRDLFESGQLAVSPLSAFYGTWATFDVGSQLETFRQAGRQARAAGYRSLRCVADLTPLAEDPDDQLLHYELAIGAVVAAEPLTGLCLYDEARSAEMLPSIACTHAFRHGDEVPVPFSFHAGRDGLYHLTGSADFTAVPELRRMLAVVSSRHAGPITISIDDLDFLDVATTRVLAAFVDRERLHGRPVRFQASRQPPITFLAFGLDAELV